MPSRTPAKPRAARSTRAVRGYELIVRGEDGRARIERFTDAAAYRRRLARLRQSPPASVSIDELVRLLDI